MWEWEKLEYEATRKVDGGLVLNQIVTDEVDLILRKERIKQALEKFLSEKERKVILARFFEELTLSKVGMRFNVGRECIRQVEAKALRKLRRPLAKKFLEEVRGL